MATVFMRWLETSPHAYDRGIRLLTLGRLEKMHDQLISNFVREESRVLEMGCGTGQLTALMVQRGATVTAVDSSQLMLDEAKRRLAKAGLIDQVELLHLDASQVGDRFEPGSFDLIVASLLFGELPKETIDFVLERIAPLLSVDGNLIVADEVVPSRLLWRPLYYFVRGLMSSVTWVLTRTTTIPLKGLDASAGRVGYEVKQIGSYLAGSLALFELHLPPERSAVVRPARDALPVSAVGRLSKKPTLRDRLVTLWALIFRIIPPYPKKRTGLYAIGRPDCNSPLLVTGNFDLTVRRLAEHLDGQVDAWLLVADSAGINVWCAAGGRYFTAEKIISAMKSARLETVVEHRTIILPQLCANGVDGRQLRRETGWDVQWGPVRAGDIASYLLAGGHKRHGMCLVTFPIKDRLEMTTVALGFYGLLIALPLFLLWPSLFWPVMVSLVALSYFYGIAQPWLPGQDGLLKSIPLSVLALAGLGSYSLLFGSMTANQTFSWSIGLIGLSLFTASEMQGMSPLMRGGQANWRWEAFIGLLLLLLYWLVPSAFGWR